MRKRDKEKRQRKRDIENKVGKSQEVLGMSCLEIFLVKDNTLKGGVDSTLAHWSLQGKGPQENKQKLPIEAK